MPATMSSSPKPPRATAGWITKTSSSTAMKMPTAIWNASR
jgi:hypothetical protein